jgi:hypothetical protein
LLSQHGYKQFHKYHIETQIYEDIGLHVYFPYPVKKIYSHLSEPVMTGRRDEFIASVA